MSENSELEKQLQVEGEPAAPAAAEKGIEAETAAEVDAAAGTEPEGGRGGTPEADAALSPSDAPSDTAQLEAALAVPKEGDLVTGHVVQVHPDFVLVDVGYKSEGVINRNDLTHRSVESSSQVVSVGDEIQAVVLSVDSEGGLRLSKRRADERAAWDSIEAWHESGQVLEAQVTEAVKGGLVVDLGLRAFLPASQVERGYVSDLNKYVGQVIRVKIIEIDARKSRVILSRKKVLEEERELARATFWDNVEEGQIRVGVVKSLTDFGAFVDLGGVDGLLHVSELSYGRVKHPSEVIKEGEEVKVRVIRLDREKGKVSLSLKQTLEDPWSSVGERFPEGTIITGRVARLATFGAFVELEPGIDGLIHISQLADYRVERPEDVVEPDQVVRVEVISVRPGERRISLSMRGIEQPEPAPSAAAASTGPEAEAEVEADAGAAAAGAATDAEAGIDADADSEDQSR